MPLYCGIDGATRKLSSMTTNIDGAQRSISKIYAQFDGVQRIIHNKADRVLSSLLILSPDAEALGWTDIPLTKNKTYEIYFIQSGGHGGNGGSNWGLYKGGGGGAGAASGVLYVKFICKADVKIQYRISHISVENGTFSVAEINFIGFANNEIALAPFWSSGYVGTNGDDSGAFKPNPSGGTNGVCNDESANIAKFTNKEVVVDVQCWPGTTQASAPGNRYGAAAPAPNPEAPFMQPQYVASSGQDAYYSTEFETLCLGNAGGGGDGGNNGGKGAPGGIILFEL